MPGTVLSRRVYLIYSITRGALTPADQHSSVQASITFTYTTLGRTLTPADQHSSVQASITLTYTILQSTLTSPTGPALSRRV